MRKGASSKLLLFLGAITYKRCATALLIKLQTDLSKVALNDIISFFCFLDATYQENLIYTASIKKATKLLLIIYLLYACPKM